MPIVAGRQIGQIRLRRRGGVPFLFAEQHIVSAQQQVLHDHSLVALELCIRREDGAIKLAVFGAVNRDPLDFAPFEVRPLFMTLGLGGMIRWGWAFVRLDIRLALLALQTIILIAEPLIFFPQGAVLGREGFDQIEQQLDRLAGVLIRNVGEI